MEKMLFLFKKNDYLYEKHIGIKEEALLARTVYIAEAAVLCTICTFVHNPRGDCCGDTQTGVSTAPVSS